MRTITFLLIIILILPLFEFSICRAESTDNVTSDSKISQRVERLEKEFENYRNELRDYKIRQELLQEAISESAKKSKETMEILDKFSAKSISFAAYTLSGIALIFTIVNFFFAYYIRTTYKDSKTIIQDTRTKVEEEFKGQLEIFNERIEKIKLDTSRMAEQFIVAMDNKRKILDSLTIAIGERIRKKVPEKDILGILDDIFREELDKQEVESFIADLQSPDKEVKERTVWGIEALGPEKLGRENTIKILQKVMDDPGEDPEIRLQAQRSIENIRRGGIV